jgi:hypothetical protein
MIFQVLTQENIMLCSQVQCHQILTVTSETSTHLHGVTSPRTAIPSSTTKTTNISLILQHIDMLLGKDRGTNERTAAAKQQPANNRGMVFSVWPPKQQLNSNIGTVFSLRSVPRLHNEGQL